MEDTTPESATEAIPERATSYFPRFAADPRYGLDLMRPLDYSCYAGSSVFLSTPSDLVRFAMAINSGKLLKPATVRLLQTSQRLTSGQETGYGLGWDLETVAVAGQNAHRRSRRRSAGRDGRVLLTFPEQGLAIALTSNTSYAEVPVENRAGVRETGAGQASRNRTARTGESAGPVRSR
jgi:CubicO group peptidase (beta-lactamase class C family)